MLADPTKAEMLEFLSSLAFSYEFDEFGREEAIYWFAAHYHGGQSSNLYSALSTSDFKPGTISTGPEDTYLYDSLVQRFAYYDDRHLLDGVSPDERLLAEMGYVKCGGVWSSKRD